MGRHPSFQLMTFVYICGKVEYSGKAMAMRSVMPGFKWQCAIWRWSIIVNPYWCQGLSSDTTQVRMPCFFDLKIGYPRIWWFIIIFAIKEQSKGMLHARYTWIYHIFRQTIVTNQQLWVIHGITCQWGSGDCMQEQWSHWIPIMPWFSRWLEASWLILKLSKVVFGDTVSSSSSQA